MAVGATNIFHRCLGGLWSCCTKRLVAWLLLNQLVVRPYLAGLNQNTWQIWGCSYPPDGGPYNTTGLDVIVAGLGRTGTHGMNMALEMLGYRTYGTYESVYYMPYVYDKTQDQTNLVQMIRACKLNAFITEPHYDLLWKLLPVSPGARVIVTTRDYESWVYSNTHGTRFGWGYYLNVGYQLGKAFRQNLCHWAPYAPLWRLVGHRGASFSSCSLSTLLLEHCVAGSFGWGIMLGNYKPDLNMEMIVNRTLFDIYHSEVRQRVPQDRLLEFDIKTQGWEDLAPFLGRKPPATGKLPRTGAGSAAPSVLRFQAHPARWWLLWFLLSLTVGVNWLAFALIWGIASPICCPTRSGMGAGVGERAGDCKEE